MQEYRMEIKVKNNLIFSKINQLGFNSVHPFCEHYELSYNKINELLNLKISPLGANGKFRPSVIKLCDALNCLPEELFTQNQLDLELETNKFTKTVSEAEMRFVLDSQQPELLIEEIIDNDRIPSEIERMLDTLTPREKKVIQARFGLGVYETSSTLSECGEMFDASRERIRQIEAKALRKLRHPIRCHHVSDLMGR